MDDRLDRIREHGHFGDARGLGGGLAELLLLGGDKNGQSKDIAQARRILARETA